MLTVHAARYLWLAEHVISHRSIAVTFVTSKTQRAIPNISYHDGSRSWRSWILLIWINRQAGPGAADRRQ